MFGRCQGSPVDWKQEKGEEEEKKDHESLWLEPLHRCGAIYRNGRAGVRRGSGVLFQPCQFLMPVRPQYGGVRLPFGHKSLRESIFRSHLYTHGPG